MSAPRSFGKKCYADGGSVSDDRRFRQIEDAEREATTGEKPEPRAEPQRTASLMDRAVGAVKRAVGLDSENSMSAPRNYPKGKKAFADGGFADGGMQTEWGGAATPNMGGGLPAIGRAQTSNLPLQGQGMAAGAAAPYGQQMESAPQMKPMVQGPTGGGFMSGQASSGRPLPPMPEVAPGGQNIFGGEGGGMGLGAAAQRAAAAQNKPMVGGGAPLMGGSGFAERAEAMPVASGMGQAMAMQDAGQAMAGGRGMGRGRMGAPGGGMARAKPMGYADGGKVKKQNSGKGGKFVPFTKNAPKATDGKGAKPKGFEKPTEKGNVIRAFADGGCVTNKRDMGKRR